MKPTLQYDHMRTESIVYIARSESSSTTESGDEGVDKDIAVWFEGLLPSDTNFITTLGTKAIIVREILLEAYARNDKV